MAAGFDASALKVEGLWKWFGPRCPRCSTGREEALVRIPVRQPCPDATMRSDPHPAWDRTGRYVTFNGFVGGTRRVFIADLAGVCRR